MGRDTTSTKGTADLEYMLPSPNYPVGFVEWNWTSNATGYVISKTNMPFAGTLTRVTTNPGATAPTANYDITVTDEDEVDILNGVGANRHTSNTETTYPQATGAVAGATGAVQITFNDLLELNISSAGVSKQGKIRLYFR